MVLQLSLKQSVCILNDSNLKFLLVRINMSIERRIRYDRKLQSSGVKFCAIRYSEIVCSRCFKPVNINEKLFRKSRAITNFRGSRYMHMDCAERSNYV
jgi:hypothetical protein